MKTARRENRKDWAEVFSNPRHGAAGQNRTCSQYVGLEARETPAMGEMFSLEFLLYRTT
jgi:hypothetical protein